MSIDLHYFRYLDPQALRRVRFVVGDVPGDTDGEPTPGAAPERATEDPDDSDDRALDHRLAEMQQRLDEWNAELSSGSDLSADNPFKGLGVDLLPAAQRLLDEAYRELSTQHEQDLAKALAEFRDNQGPIQQKLSSVLLAASDSWGLLYSPPHSELGDALVSMPPEDSEIQDGLYTVKSGDTMYGILTRHLSADPALKQNTATHYGLNENLPPSDFVLQLFQNVPRLKQDLIYPGDTVLFQARGGILYRPKLQSSTPPPAPEQPEEAPASTGDGLAQLDEEPAADDELESDSESDADRDDRTPEPILEDEAAGSEAEAVPAVEAAPAPAVAAPEASIPIVDLGTIQGLPDIWGTGPEVQQERVPQTREDFMAAFPGLRINPNDFPITVVEHPTYAGKNLVRVQINRFALRGKIQQVAPGDLQASASSEGGEGDDAKALGEALTQLTTMFRGTTYKVLTEQSQQEHADSNHVPEDFHELNDFLASPENNDIYDLEVTPKPQNPEKIGDPFRYNITVTFEVDGYSGKVDLHWPTNPEIQGKTMKEARKNAYAAIMLKYLPDAVAETRQKATAHADYLLDADGKVEGPPVGAKENFDYFLNSLEQNPDGSVTFQFYHPLSELNHQIPCTGRLSPNGTLHIEAPGSIKADFQLSYTALFNNREEKQPLNAVRFGDTVPAAANHQEQPWLQQLTDDRTGRVTGMDMIITDDLLYKIVRDALSKKVPQPGGPDYAAPETFSRRYQAANDFSDVQKHLPDYQRLPIQGNFLWVKPIERKP